MIHQIFPALALVYVGCIYLGFCYRNLIPVLVGLIAATAAIISAADVGDTSILITACGAIVGAVCLGFWVCIPDHWLLRSPQIDRVFLAVLAALVVTTVIASRVLAT